MNRYITEYTDFLKIEKRHSINTVVAYQRDLNLFHTFFSNTELSAVTTSDIRSFLIFLRNSGLASSTVARCLSTLKSFYNYLFTEKLILENPTEIIESSHAWRKLPYVMSIVEVDALMTTPDIKTPNGLRDLAMLELLYATGLRVSELITVKMDTIDFLVSRVSFCR